MGYFGELYYPETKRIFVGEPIEDMKTVAAALETKYNTAKQGADALDIMASNLDVLDKDYSIKKARIESIRNGFKDFAGQGNWEDAGATLQKQYKDYATDKGLSHAQKQYSARTSYSTALTGNSDLSDEDRVKLLWDADSKYSGVKVDETTGMVTGNYSGYAPNKFFDKIKYLDEITKGWEYNKDSNSWVAGGTDNSPYITSGKMSREYRNFSELRAAALEALNSNKEYNNWLDSKTYIDTIGVDINKENIQDLMVQSGIVEDTDVDPDGSKTYLAYLKYAKSLYPSATEEQLNKNIYKSLYKDIDSKEGADWVANKYDFVREDATKDIKNDELYTIKKKWLLDNTIVPIDKKVEGVVGKTYGFEDVATLTISKESALASAENELGTLIANYNKVGKIPITLTDLRVAATKAGKDVVTYFYDNILTNPKYASEVKRLDEGQFTILEAAKEKYDEYVQLDKEANEEAIRLSGKYENYDDYKAKLDNLYIPKDRITKVKNPAYVEGSGNPRYVVHVYDKDGSLKKSFNTSGDDDTDFKTANVDYYAAQTSFEEEKDKYLTEKSKETITTHELTNIMPGDTEETRIKNTLAFKTWAKNPANWSDMYVEVKDEDGNIQGGKLSELITAGILDSEDVAATLTTSDPYVTKGAYNSKIGVEKGAFVFNTTAKVGKKSTTADIYIPSSSFGQNVNQMFNTDDRVLSQFLAKKQTTRLQNVILSTLSRGDYKLEYPTSMTKREVAEGKFYNDSEFKITTPNKESYTGENAYFLLLKLMKIGELNIK